MRRGHWDSWESVYFLCSTFTTATARTFGSFSSPCSTSLLIFLNSRIHTPNRPSALTASSFPFNQSLSPFSNDSSHREVVCERRWSWSSVTESEEFVGRMRAVSRLPQYL